MKDALGVEEPDGELLILPRSAHCDRNRLVNEHAPAAKTENDFERFLHSELIEIVVHSIFGAVPANTKVSNARGLHMPESVALFPRPSAKLSLCVGPGKWTAAVWRVGARRSGGVYLSPALLDPPPGIVRLYEKIGPNYSHMWLILKSVICSFLLATTISAGMRSRPVNTRL